MMANPNVRRNPGSTRFDLVWIILDCSSALLSSRCIDLVEDSAVGKKPRLGLPPIPIKGLKGEQLQFAKLRCVLRENRTVARTIEVLRDDFLAGVGIKI